MKSLLFISVFIVAFQAATVHGQWSVGYWPGGAVVDNVPLSSLN
jgi:hypothetical protein